MGRCASFRGLGNAGRLIHYGICFELVQTGREGAINNTGVVEHVSQ